MLASAFLCRGNGSKSVPMSDFVNNVLSAQKKMIFPIWNMNACKVSFFFIVILFIFLSDMFHFILKN